MVKKIKEKRAKKRWFSVLAPAIFNQKQLSDITAFEPKELVGRKIEVSLKEFTASHKDSFKRIVLRIVKVQGDTAYTEADRFFVLDSYVQRAAKKFKTNILVVKKVKTKDKLVKVKSVAFIQKRIQRKVRTNLAKLIENTVEFQVSEKSSQEVFSPKFISTIFSSSKKQVKKIYPVDRLFVWKISVLN